MLCAFTERDVTSTPPRPTTGSLGAGSPRPPIAKREPTVRELHGETVIDAYAWMKDRTSAAVEAHLAAENAHTAAALAHLAPHAERIFEEIRHRTQETDTSVPVRHGAYWYVVRTEEGRQYPVSCRRVGRADGPEQILLDVNVLAVASPYFALGVHEVSPDHRWLAYSTDHTGGERYTLHVRDLATGGDLADRIEDTASSVAWSRDGSQLLYTRADDAHRPYQVWCHRVGTAPSTDVLVFEEDDERFNVDVDLTRSEEWIVVHSASHTTSEAWLIDAAAPGTPPRCVRPRAPGVEYWVDHERGVDGGTLVLLTTEDAPNRRVATAPARDPPPGPTPSATAPRCRSMPSTSSPVTG